MSVTNTMRDAALNYAAEGWPVFPVSPHDKRALIKEWQNAASVDPAQIAAWWLKWPTAMIGSLQGPNGCFAVDLDIVNKDTGEVFEPEVLRAALEEACCAIPETRIAETGSGGWHIYLRIPSGASVPRKIRRLPQIDICGERGYTILPPSRRSDGKSYRWLNDVVIAEAPQEFVAFVNAGKSPKSTDTYLAPSAVEDGHLQNGNADVDSRVADNRRKYAYAALARAVNDVAGCKQGARNQALNNAALSLGHLVGAGLLSQSTVRADLFSAAAACGLVKDDGAESVSKTIASGLSAGIARPADLSQIGTRVSSARPQRDVPAKEKASSPHDVGGGAATSAPPLERDDIEDPGEQVASDDINWEVLRLCLGEPLNDIGNSRRLRHRFGDSLLHIQNVGFFGWDGKRWAEDTDLRQAKPMCHQTAENIALEALLIEPTATERADIESAQAARTVLKDCERRLVELSQRDLKAGERRAQEQEIKAEREVARDSMIAGRNALAKLADRKARRRKFSVASGNAGKLNGMLDEALAFISRPILDMDVDPYALNVGNGTLRFAERRDIVGRWHVTCAPHARSDMITKLAAVDYDPKAEAPEFHKFLSAALPNENVRGFLQRYFGYSLTALTSEQVFVILHGEGRNGKSTLVDIMAKILADYSTSIPISTLVNDNRAGKGSEATPDLARLPGARLVRSAEPREGLSFDESLIKGLISGEPLPVRRLNKEFIDIYPTFKLIISVNRKPTIKGNDDGIWRRVRLVPFEVQVEAGKEDKALPEKLWGERSGILNWMIEGALDYFERGGLDAPQEVLVATQEYREESDLVGSFVRAALDITGESYDQMETGALYSAYIAYAKRSGLQMMSGTTFARRLPKTATQFGILKGKSSLTVYSGIKLREGFEPIHPASTPSDTHHD